MVHGKNILDQKMSNGSRKFSRLRKKDDLDSLGSSENRFKSEHPGLMRDVRDVLKMFDSNKMQDIQNSTKGSMF